MDVFVEPILPKPALLVLGASPIAVALADLAAKMGFDVTVAAGKDDLARFGPVASKIEGFEIPPTNAPWLCRRVDARLRRSHGVESSRRLGRQIYRVRGLAAEGGDVAGRTRH